MSPKKRITQFLFDRYFRWRLEELVAPQYPIVLEYPINPQPRYGYGKPPHQELYKIFNDGRTEYEANLRRLLGITDLVRNIASTPEDKHATTEPSFINSYFVGLDAIALMAFLKEYRPRLLLEIGSGNSTRFARRAIREFQLPTQIVSCDPAPRAEIRTVSDEILQQSAETLAQSVFDRLGPGDVLFIDSSHRVFQNSDVTMLFLEILPRLSSGVIVHFHDILLPDDYPPQWADRFYSEQYLLALWLLANPKRFEILLPNAFISRDHELSTILNPIWAFPEMRKVQAHALSLMHGFLGYSLWLRIV